MLIHILRLARLKLHHHILIVPEQRLDKAHFLPGRAAHCSGHADVFPRWRLKAKQLPIYAIGYHRADLVRAPQACGDNEHAVIPVARVSTALSVAHAVLLRDVKGQGADSSVTWISA